MRTSHEYERAHVFSICVLCTLFNRTCRRFLLWRHRVLPLQWFWVLWALKSKYCDWAHCGAFALTLSGEVVAVVGGCEALGSWCHQKAVILSPVGDGCSTSLLRTGRSKWPFLPPCINVDIVQLSFPGWYGRQRSLCHKGGLSSIAILRASFLSQRWAETSCSFLTNSYLFWYVWVLLSKSCRSLAKCCFEVETGFIRCLPL